MKRLTLPLVLICLAGAGRAQLLPDQKLLDFQQLAALYAKQYAPYEWKRDALKIDLLQLSPWLDRVRNTKNDIEFYEICAAYVASLNDAHSEFFLPTDFQADLLFDVDQYDGKALIDFIDPSLGRGFSFRVGDELISVDGKPVADWIKEFGKYNAFGNPRSTDRSSASLITFRDQSIYPRAAEIGADGDDVAAPKSRRPYMQALLNLRNYRLPEQKNLRGFGALTPVFSLPTGFVRRLGRNGDFFYSGTYTSGGKRIGFIRIPDFLDSSTIDNEGFALQQFQTEINFMQANTDGLVLDVMRNPGGDGCYAESLLLSLIPYRFRGMGQEVRVTRDWVLAFSEAIDQANFFGADQLTIDQLSAILAQLQNAYKQNHVRTDGFPQCATYYERDPTTDRNGNVIAYKKPILLLTDEFSVSSAEIFAALFQDSKRGPILGWRTAGAGGSIPFSPTATGFYSEASALATQTLMVRNEQVYTADFPTTSYIENVGVRPNIEVDYMTEANLTDNGKAFVDAFTAAILDLLK